MNIDFNKLVTLLLPTFIRTMSVADLVKALTGSLQQLHTEFQAWQNDIRLQAAMTCQVMYLETILNYRLLDSFLRSIYITDGNGVTVDFIVNLASGVSVDNYRMIALIEKYKIAGKRYSIQQSDYTYEVHWSDLVCELVNMTYTANWTDFACEKVDIAPTNNPISIIQSDYSVFVQSMEPVASTLTVILYLTIAHTGNDGNYEFIIPAGSVTSNAFNSSYLIQSAVPVSITPESDDTFIYINN
jgi:hypothetical protein